MSKVLSLPEASMALHVSLDRLRSLLKLHPDVDAQLPRLGGRNRLVGPEQLELLRGLLAEGPAAKAAVVG
jgi:hypothetical protein